MDLFADIVQPQKQPEVPPEKESPPSRRPVDVPLPVLTTGIPVYIPLLSNPFEPDSVYWHRVVIAIALSLFLNFFLLWISLVFHITDWTWLKPAPKPHASKEMTQLVLMQRPPPIPRHESPTFLETDPSQAEREKPKDAPFYSEHNTRATQTSATPEKSNEMPNMNGNNTKTMATETVLPTRPAPPPSPPMPEGPATPPEKPAAPPSSPQKSPPDNPTPGDLALLKKPEERPFTQTESPTENSKTNPQTAPRAPPAPKTLPQSREVLAQQSKIAGGVNRVGKAYAFDSAESPFASYDKKIIGKIGAYWQPLVQNKFYGETIGEVEVSFKLMADGRITELQVTHNSANSVLAGWCLQAIQQSAPFDPFPDTMKAIAGDFREGSITFAY